LAKLVKNRNMVTVAILDVEILGMRSLSVYNRAVHIVTHINASTEKVQLTNTADLNLAHHQSCQHVSLFHRLQIYYITNRRIKENAFIRLNPVTNYPQHLIH